MKALIPSIEKQELYWDWWQETRSINKIAQKRAEIILNMVNSLGLDNPKILDYGCGNGWFSVKLSELGKVTGIDLSKKHINSAQKSFPTIKFIAADIFNYFFENNSFDIVVSQQVICHVSDKNEYVNRIIKLLKDKGHLIISCNNKLVMDRIEGRDHKNMGHIEDWLTLRGLINLLKPSFNIIEKASIIPKGNSGFLRIVNSYKLNILANMVFGEENIKNLKEKLGLGYINIVLAQKK